MKSFSGEVKVYINNSWINVNKTQELFLGEKIKTNNGKTKIILQGKANIYLKKNSEIEIISLKKNNLSIKLIKGIIENIFSKTKQYSYFVKLSNSTISVKGTNFIVKNLNNEKSVFVKSGEVLFKNNLSEILLKKYDKAKLDNNKIELVIADKKEILPILQNNINSIKKYKQKRLEKIEENTLLLKIAKKTYGLSKQDIITKLDLIDSGEIDDSLLIEKAPFKKDELREIKKINDRIKYSNSEIRYIKNKFNYSLD